MLTGQQFERLHALLVEAMLPGKTNSPIREALPRHLALRFDQLPGGSVRAICVWLIEYCERENLLEGLAALALELDPACHLQLTGSSPATKPEPEVARSAMPGQQFLEFRAALLSGFVDETDLSYLLRVYCEKDLAALSPASGPGSLSETIRFVLDRASKQGWLRALVVAAVEENPANPQLAEYSKKFGHQETLPLDELYTALLDSFPSLGWFEQLLSFGLGRSLASMRMENLVIDVMESAEQDGWLADLAAGAYALRPGNPQVRSIYFQLFPDRVLAQILADKFDRQTASLVLRKIGRRMADIPRTGAGSHLFQDLASSARLEGWIADFVRALLADNPAVEELQLLMAELPKLPELQPPKSLSGKQLGLLHAAMMSVFEIEGLRRFLRFNFEQNLDELSAGGKKQDVIFDVLSASERQGWTRKLMRESVDAFPEQDAYRQKIESLERELT